MNGPPSNSCQSSTTSFALWPPVVDLYAAWNAAEPGKGYDARAEQVRARLPVNEEEHANDAGPSGGDESCFERSGRPPAKPSLWYGRAAMSGGPERAQPATP